MKLEIDTTQSIEDIIKQVEEAKAKQEPKRWRAKEDEKYYFVTGDNKVFDIVECLSKNDNTLFLTGNYFQTKEEAEQEARLRDFEQRVAARIKELNGDKVHKFNPGSESFSIDINLNVSSVVSRHWCDHYLGQRGWWSNRREVIEQVIEEFGKENFIKWAKGEL